VAEVRVLGSPAGVSRETEAYGRLVTAQGEREMTAAMEDLVGAVVEGLEDVKTTGAARRKLLGVAMANIDLLERYLSDPFTSDEKRVRALLKAFEIGVKVPGAQLDAEGPEQTFRVRVGGG
jgi:hypothetical protein